MDARVPQQAVQILSPFFPPGTSWDFDLRIAPLRGSISALSPCSVGPRDVMAVSAVGAERSLRPIGRSTDGIVILHPNYADLNTAAGLALLGHEREHQDQYKAIPHFQSEYNRANRGVDPDRPWENPFELEAYMKERDIFCGLVARGVPAGSWVPLGVEEFGC